MFDQVTLPLGWTVELNCHQAAAYCRWLGAECQLPSEAQFHRYARNYRIRQAGRAVVSNHHFRFCSPTPISWLEDYPDLGDPWGNVWQWLRNDFYPLSGFCRHPLYPDFSQPYFGPRHGMMIGGSWATTGMAAERWYRLWFRRHFIQHAGFRVVRPFTARST